MYRYVRQEEEYKEKEKEMEKIKKVADEAKVNYTLFLTIIHVQ